MGNTLHDLLARVDHIRDECDGVPAVLHTYAASDLWEILNGLADASRKLADRLDSAHRREEALLAGAPPATREQLHHEWRAGFDARYAAESAAPPEAPQPQVLWSGRPQWNLGLGYIIPLPMLRVPTNVRVIEDTETPAPHGIGLDGRCPDCEACTCGPRDLDGNHLNPDPTCPVHGDSETEERSDG